MSQAELNTPLPYPPSLPTISDFPQDSHIGPKSVSFFPFTEMDRIQAHEAGPSSSRNVIIPGASADAGVPVKKEKKKRKHRHRDTVSDMTQVQTRPSEVYPGGYVAAPFPVQVEEDTPRAQPRQLDAYSVPPPPPQPPAAGPSQPPERTTVHRDNFRPPSSEGSFVSWGTNVRNSTSTLGSGMALRSSFAAAPIDEEELEVPVGDMRAFLPPVRPAPQQTHSAPAPLVPATAPITAPAFGPAPAPAPAPHTRRRARTRSSLPPMAADDSLDIPVGDPRGFLPVRPPVASPPVLTTPQQGNDHRHRAVPPVPVPQAAPPRRRHARSESTTGTMMDLHFNHANSVLRPATSSSTSSAGQFYVPPSHALPPVQTQSNALGLDLSRHAPTPNPHIIAPAPQMADTRVFLRSFSSG